jgi:nucleoside phosphorylase
VKAFATHPEMQYLMVSASGPNGKRPSSITRKALGMDPYRTTEQVRAEFGGKPRRALIITTVVYESRAVQAHLVDVERIAGSNGDIYEMGRFPDPTGEWHVIHAITAAGNSDASVVATKAHAEFGKFNVQMFVGVAGSLKEDIPIGSVVVGEYVYNSHSGKVDDKGYYSRPHSHEAAPELLKAAKMLVLDGDWVDFIKDPKRAKLPATDAYPCPFPPEAFIKGIASGELVVAGGNTPFYQTIRQYLNDAGAVEMEGWGAMSAAHQEKTSAIVVRGISDMCDGKDHISDAQHQPIASAHAAAFAFATLSIRSKASPLRPDGGDLPRAHTVTLQEEPVPVPDQRFDYVVNFKGSFSEWSDDKIARVVEGLREVTGDPELTLVRVEEGSVRLVLSVREKDIPALTLEAIRASAGDVGEELLGAVTARALSEAEQAKAALKRQSAHLLSWEQTLPDGGWLERPEQRIIENRFHSKFSSTVVLGEPGSGKSALLAAIATDLIKAEASVLAIKADFVSPDVHSEQDLQADLRLPVPPGELIELLSQLQPVFLFVDQLDALASQLDLRSDRLNVLLNLIRRVGGVPNVHVVLSARTFEFNHDVRLRAIEAEAVTLALPAWHDVKEKLSAAGIDANTWPESAREVVRNPQHLKTYLSLGKSNDNQPFSKYQSMLEQLWRQKIATAQDSEALATLASDLAADMAEEELLWLAASRFDTRAPTLERLESVGLIVRSDNGQSIAFSHQTVFDYVLARSFVRAAGRLSAYVLERQNSLFVRAKLWSALRYLRDAEVASYEREFLEIWRHQSLRLHLRLLLIEFLGEQHSPVAFEKVCLEEVMQSNELRVAGLKAIIGSAGWFANFARSAIPAAMSQNDIEANQALRILQKAWSFSADEVVRLLREQWLQTPAKDNFTWMTLDACATWTEAVEEIARRILSRTPISPWQVDYAASVLAVEQPNVAFRLIRAKLDFMLESARSTPPGKPFPKNSTHDDQVAWHITDDPTKPFTVILEGSEWNSLPAMAEAEPTKFLEALWPWFRAIFVELTVRLRKDVTDHVYPGQYSIDVGLGDDTSGRITREQPILSGLRLAVEGAANNNEAVFQRWVEENSDLEFMAPQRLIAHGFGFLPETHAQQAFNWLLNDQRRLQLGNPHGLRQTTAALIRAVSPYWSDVQVRDFESEMQKYRPKTPAHLMEAKQRRYFSRFLRSTRTQLLAAVPLDRLSEKSRGLIATEKRALGENLDPGIRFSGSSWIGSPMEAEAMAKAKDRDILKVFEEVPDNKDWDHPTTWMRGGNIQLSRAFAEFTKSEPMRALRIIEQFKPKAQERAAGYALASLAEVGSHDREIQDALIDLNQRGFGSEEFRNSTADAVEKIANRHAPIDEALVAALIEWLNNPVEQSDPSDAKEASEIGERDEVDRANDARNYSILWGHGGVSILPRGNFPILSALTSILLKGNEEGRDRLLVILNDHLVRERNPKVWQALLIQLSHAGGSTPEVVSRFLRALFVRFPSLLETREAVYFLAYAQRWDDVLVHDLIATWERAENPMLRQAQGELVGLVATVQGSDRWTKTRDELVERGSAEAKIGLAHAGANLWAETQYHTVAGELLERLIPGADKDRMSAILDVFRLSDDLVPEPTTLAFLRTLAAPGVDLGDAPSSFIVEKLQSLLPHAAAVVGEIALKLVDARRSNLRDVRTATAIAAPQLTDLAITLHRLGGASRETGVTVFEALIDLDAYGARDTLTEIDGRFGVYQTGARRRLARRAANSVKRRAA